MVGYGEITLKWVLESYGSRNTWMMDNFQNDYKRSLSTCYWVKVRNLTIPIIPDVDPWGGDSNISIYLNISGMYYWSTCTVM
jgi:hypothetical protein